ncbi:MAG: TSUP family transporter, partial [Candidatus Limnocylindria bacterium]
RDVHPGVAFRFLAGAIPATVVGVVFYAGAPAESVRWIMGAFLIASVPLRRLMLNRNVTVRLRHFPVVGALVGVLSGIVVATGPVATPFFLAYGLRRGAYIGTESVCALGMHVARGLAFASFALITWETVAVGLVLGAIMFVGAWLGRGLLDRISDRTFLTVLEVFLVLMGLQFLLVSR